MSGGDDGAASGFVRRLQHFSEGDQKSGFVVNNHAVMMRSNL